MKLIPVVVLVLVLAACGGGGSTAAKKAATPTTEKTAPGRTKLDTYGTEACEAVAELDTHAVNGDITWGPSSDPEIGSDMDMIGQMIAGSDTFGAKSYAKLSPNSLFKRINRLNDWCQGYGFDTSKEPCPGFDHLVFKGDRLRSGVLCYNMTTTTSSTLPVVAPPPDPYDQIQTGMTIAQVNQITGGCTQNSTSSAGGYTAEVDDCGSIIVEFGNGRVTGKARA